MASDVALKGKNGSNNTLIDKRNYHKAQRASSRYSDNINPLAVLISLPLASLHRSIKPKYKRAACSR